MNVPGPLWFCWVQSTVCIFVGLALLAFFAKKPVGGSSRDLGLFWMAVSVFSWTIPTIGIFLIGNNTSGNDQTLSIPNWKLVASSFLNNGFTLLAIAHFNHLPNKLVPLAALRKSTYRYWFLAVLAVATLLATQLDPEVANWFDTFLSWMCLALLAWALCFSFSKRGVLLLSWLVLPAVAAQIWAQIRIDGHYQFDWMIISKIFVMTLYQAHAMAWAYEMSIVATLTMRFAPPKREGDNFTVELDGSSKPVPDARFRQLLMFAVHQRKSPGSYIRINALGRDVGLEAAVAIGPMGIGRERLYRAELARIADSLDSAVGTLFDHDGAGGWRLRVHPKHLTFSRKLKENNVLLPILHPLDEDDYS